MSACGDVAGAVRKARARLTIDQCRSLLTRPEEDRRVVWHSPGNDGAPGIPCVVVKVGGGAAFIRQDDEPPGPGHRVHPGTLTLAEEAGNG